MIEVNIPTADQIESADTAREIAIDWQSSLQDNNYSYGELIEWQSYFESLAAKFPELEEEFKENAII